jgi:cytochrome c556
MKRQWVLWAAIAGLCIGVGAQVLAQPNPNQLINSRKGAMNLQAKYFFPILNMAQGKANYDAKLVQRNADYLVVLTQLAWDDFQPHTLGLKNTRAKEDIVKDASKFRAGAEQLQKQIQQLQAAARSGDENAVKAVAPDIARTCNGCHENFSTIDWRIKI